LQDGLPNYTVFIHLVNSNGDLVAQRDSMPVCGFRPTASWSAGEIIRDQHGLQFPKLSPGQYALWAGLYNSNTSERLPVQLIDGTTADHLVLDVLEVQRNDVGQSPSP
jgi:hypothetical protein